MGDISIYNQNIYYYIKRIDDVMKSFLKKLWTIVDKILPILLIFLSVYIYNDIMKENKKLREKIESLTNLVSYKTRQIIENSEKPSEK